MNSMKRQKDMTPEDGHPMSEGVQYDNGEKQEQLSIVPERMTQLGQGRNYTQFWVCPVLKVNSNAVKNLHKDMQMIPL